MLTTQESKDNHTYTNLTGPVGAGWVGRRLPAPRSPSPPARAPSAPPPVRSPWFGSGAGAATRPGDHNLDRRILSLALHEFLELDAKNKDVSTYCIHEV